MAVSETTYLMKPVDLLALKPAEAASVSELINSWICYSLDVDLNETLKLVENFESYEYIKVLVGVCALHKNDHILSETCLKGSHSSTKFQPEIRSILTSSVYRTLANSLLLQNESKKAVKYFRLAASEMRVLDAEVIGENLFYAKSRLGLIDSACSDIEKRLLNLIEGLSADDDVANKIIVLHSEVELLRHELTIAQQKQQLYLIPDQEGLRTELSDTSQFKKQLESYSPSQLGQDIWVLQRHSFKRDGFFVEFGATDGVLLSNSFLLEKFFGWKGLCAEPNPRYFEKLKENRKCTISNQCISGKTGESVEFIFADEYGGIATYSQDDNHATKRAAYESQNGRAILKTISLHDFLLQHNAPKSIDYLSIDTEGSELDILSALPFDYWEIKCITVEHNFSSNRERIYDLLTSKGYKRQEAQFDDWYYKD